jgi:hypothetical protein
MARGGPEELCGHIFWMGNLLLRISRHLSLRHCLPAHPKVSDEEAGHTDPEALLSFLPAYVSLSTLASALQMA